ncbi:hypothetical protein GCM10010269_12000 [Streptomyces humidus]|uniref:Uncharacterized protein n=1 Tax=Streptomyces humidus TaxID=52259 RepID=A0A918L237_9ACTN|nr:hypothetical protein [Streptomyces humidus]GGR74536.1 hypothetical protein GCM10010269_12000 [Streptomyces humidus]
MGAALCASSAPLPGPAAVAAPDVTAYAYSDDARTVQAATGTTGAAGLEPGATYRSSLSLSSPAGNQGRSPDESQGQGHGQGENQGRGTGGEAAKAYFRLELDDVSNVYVAVTAIPRAGSELAVGDGISVSVQDADSTACSRDSAIIGASKSPQPITAWGARELLPGRGSCHGAGTYYVVVERTRTRAGASAGTGASAREEPWELEIAPVSEPALRTAVATSVPEEWDSATPTPPTGAPVTVRGGAGFAKATAVEQGVWRDEIVPGQTLFYKVPVDWGRQMSASVDLGSADKDSGYVVDALDMTLYNPVRAEVKDVSVGYGGRQKSAALAPVPPVRYVNRYASASATKALRFAGSYYLVVHLAAQVDDRFGAGPYGLTLRVRVGGSTQAAPGYAGRSAPRGFFDVGARDPELSAGPGLTSGNASGGAGASDGEPAMKAVAVGGIGAGSVLLAVLGAWTLTARRRAAAQMRANAQNPTA